MIVDSKNVRRNKTQQLTNSLSIFRSRKTEDAFIIIYTGLGQHLVPEIHSVPQVSGIYVFGSNTSRHETWTEKWTKIKDVYINTKEICETVTTGVTQYNQDSIAIPSPSSRLKPFKQVFLQIVRISRLCMETSGWCHRYGRVFECT
ncbi:unnamed protein product [Adineta ricciae]|uniref:Uncharacterized protein n=1 Tax=Adineta ricciae TaxID=249248 RepID=A0A814L4N2_ADIRI|nr:unnamed protein product [Adineta ricciae]